MDAKLLAIKAALMVVFKQLKKRSVFLQTLNKLTKNIKTQRRMFQEITHSGKHTILQWITNIAI